MTISRICRTAPLGIEIPKFACGVISRRNHPCKVSCRSLKGFLISEGLKIGVFLWQGSSPLQQFCTCWNRTCWYKRKKVTPPCDFFDCPVLSCPYLLFSWSCAQVEPLDRFSRFMAQTSKDGRFGLERWVTIFGGTMPQNPQKWAWTGNFNPKRQNIKIAISPNL